MWERIKPGDILEAKQRLRLRVDETLKRHVEEMQDLDKDRAELETLSRLVATFSRKFKGAPAEDAADASAEDAPEESAEGADASAEEAPDASAEDAPAASAEDAPDAADEEAPDASDEESPDDSHEEAADPSAEDAPDTAAQDAPVAAAETKATGKQTEPAAANSGKSNASVRQLEQRDRGPRTNFDAFSRAVAKNQRGW